MKAFSISQLAEAAGVSVHVVRDHVLRGLLRPVSRTASGYTVFDEHALARLRFVRQAFNAGIGLRDLVKLCGALDGNHAHASACVDSVLQQVQSRREALKATETLLTALRPGRTTPRSGFIAGLAE